jgi:hypothetical protein
LAEKTPAQSLDEVMASLRVEFIERANDHLDELDAAIRSAEHGSAGNFPDAYEFRRNVHSLKGSDEVPKLLAPIYSWFTEGFDTPDLIDTQALVEALGCASRSWPACLGRCSAALG